MAIRSSAPRTGGRTPCKLAYIGHSRRRRMWRRFRHAGRSARDGSTRVGQAVSIRARYSAITFPPCCPMALAMVLASYLLRPAILIRSRAAMRIGRPASRAACSAAFACSSRAASSERSASRRASIEERVSSFCGRPITNLAKILNALPMSLPTAGVGRVRAIVRSDSCRRTPDRDRTCRSPSLNHPLRVWSGFAPS